MREDRSKGPGALDLVHLIDGVMVLDSGGTVVAFSEGAERITGFMTSEIVGKTCQEVFRSSTCEIACPARRTFETGVVLSNCRCHICTRDDCEIEVAVNTSPLRGSDGTIVGAVVVFRNLNEMMEMAIELTELSHEIIREKERSEAIINSIADGVFTLSTDMTLTSFNKSAEAITGYSAEEVLGKPCKNIFRSKGCDQICPVRQMLVSGRPVTGVEMEMTTKNGVKVPVSMSTAVLRDETGDVIGAVETFRDLSTVKTLTEELRGKYSFRNIIGKSHKMRDVYQLIKSVAPTNVTVLIQGNTGTGKELVARAIHYESPRADKPFVVVNCAALPETLLESELFGHVRGAFTGAIADRKGRFERADGGTVFLDEIAEVSPAIQVKLLRVLETKQFERVGDSQTKGVDVRLVSATNRNLKELIGRGEFREDLYYRINVVAINLPPLRERDEDIPLLVDHFVEKLNADTGKHVRQVSQGAMDVLIDHVWPGNVRELENAIGHAFVHCRGDTILPEHLPRELVEVTPHAASGMASAGSIEEMEKAAVTDMLKRCKGNRSQAARRLGIGRSSLWRKIKKYGLTHSPD
ncbi:MAG: sigma 54-interacting transcriptional regulator [Candidatus Eisenbacteria bacterium]